jgi:hypothetical protein
MDGKPYSTFDTRVRAVQAVLDGTPVTRVAVHLTETCDDDTPHLITHVETTPAPVADGDVTSVIHEDLQTKELLPGKHLADTGYVDAELFVRSQQKYGIDLVGPTRADYHWQAGAGQGFAAGDFRVDWEEQGTAQFKEAYGKRAGVEGTISQGVRVCGLRRSRYAGEAKTHLQHLATAAAVNVLRIGDWLAEKPREQTRTSASARLMAPLATAA